MLDKWESDAAEKILKAEETFNYQVSLFNNFFNK